MNTSLIQKHMPEYRIRQIARIRVRLRALASTISPVQGRDFKFSKSQIVKSSSADRGLPRKGVAVAYPDGLRQGRLRTEFEIFNHESLVVTRSFHHATSATSPS
jgi:hypothetical protein